MLVSGEFLRGFPEDSGGFSAGADPTHTNNSPGCSEHFPRCRLAPPPFPATLKSWKWVRGGFRTLRFRFRHRLRANPPACPGIGTGGCCNAFLHCSPHISITTRPFGVFLGAFERSRFLLSDRPGARLRNYSGKKQMCVHHFMLKQLSYLCRYFYCQGNCAYRCVTKR